MTTTMKNAQAQSRLDALKAETVAAIDSGKFASCPADAEGITPQTRLTWVAPSIDYIKGVAASLPTKKVEEALKAKPEVSDEDELMFSYITCVEQLSKDKYVTEGKYNLTRALEILNAEVAEDEVVADDKDTTEEEDAESLLDKVKSKFCKRKCKPTKAKTSTKKDAELKARIAKLEAEKADSDARADAAEAEVRRLKEKLKALGVIT